MKSRLRTPIIHGICSYTFLGSLPLPAMTEHPVGFWRSRFSTRAVVLAALLNFRNCMKDRSFDMCSYTLLGSVPITRDG